MRQPTTSAPHPVRQTRFPAFLYVMIFGVMLLMSGFHMGFIVLMDKLGANELIQTLVPILYWAIAAFCVTGYTRWQMKKAYDKPMKQLADATARVARGDFSVYLPPFHAEDAYDYLDVMLLNFDKMVEELGSIETLKTDFFSNVSHELKTPIAIIQSSAQLLKNENLPAKERQEYVTSIYETTQKLSALITNLLKLNKLEKQTIQPMPQPYDISAQLCACIAALESQWEQKSIEVEVDAEDRAIFLGDETLLEVVWNNLLQNAIKFTPQGGTITLHQASDENQITVLLIDTGCGMSEETRKHSFDKFYQGDSSHATDGNGLGLALALRIVQLHDGSIEVESEIGKGSRFLVTLPNRKEETQHE